MFIFKFNALFASAFAKDLAIDKIPMLLGEPGIGKSSWIEALAKSMHTKCFTLACNQLADKADLTGARLVPDGHDEYKQVFYPHQIVADAIHYALENPREMPILFLDELNRTTSDVTSACLNLATSRTIGSKTLPINLRVVCAGNDKGNITSLDEASQTRFAMYRVAPDVGTFLSLDPELNVFIKNVLSAHPETLFCKKIRLAVTGDEATTDAEEVDLDELLEETDMAQISTPRTISGLSRWLNTCTSQELIELISVSAIFDEEETNALAGIVEAHVGKTMFTAFLMQEIASGIMSTNNQSAVKTVPKPVCYDTCKASKTVSEMHDFIDTMSENDKAGCLVYALYEAQDNALLISAIAAKITKLEGPDMKTLIGLYATDQLDHDNLEHLKNLNTPISTTLNLVMN